MSDPERGFARATSSLDELTESLDGLNTDPEAHEEEVEWSRIEASEGGAEGRYMDERVSEILDVDLDAAGREHDLMMEELYDPLGTASLRSTATTSEEDAEIRAKEIRAKLYEDMARWSIDPRTGESTATVPSPEGPLSIDPPSDYDVAVSMRPNMFVRLHERAKAVARERVQPVAARHAKALVIGVLLLGAAGLYMRHRSEIGPLFARETVGLTSSFGTIREIVSAPGDFLREGLAAEMGSDYVLGAATAEIAVLEQTFMAVTDPEARLAVATAAIERALREYDTQALVTWLKRLEWIDGVDQDSRAAVLRQFGYTRLAEVRREEGRGEDAARWERFAADEQRKRSDKSRPVSGRGWTSETAEQVRFGLQEVERGAVLQEGGAQYQAGYNAALAAARQSYRLMLQMAITPQAQVRSRLGRGG